jgi:hypothetical protein
MKAEKLYFTFTMGFLPIAVAPAGLNVMDWEKVVKQFNEENILSSAKRVLTIMHST